MDRKFTTSLNVGSMKFNVGLMRLSSTADLSSFL